MKVITIVQVDFDGLENDVARARSEREVATFVDNADGYAFSKAQDWVRGQAPVQHYLGWDEQVYPQFIVKSREATR